MCSCYNEFVRDEYSAAFVLREKSQPRRFPDKNLPRPFAEGGTFAANDSSWFNVRSDATFLFSKNREE